MHEGETGELSIGFTSSAPFIKPVSDSLFRFRQRYTDVHLQMREVNTREHIVPLNEGGFTPINPIRSSSASILKPLTDMKWVAKHEGCYQLIK